MIAIIVGVGIIWIVYAISNHTPKKKNSEKKTDSNEDLKVNVSGNEQGQVEPESNSTPQKTLDEFYAEATKSWICGYCETLNPNASNRCVACGHTK